MFCSNRGKKNYGMLDLIMFKSQQLNNSYKTISFQVQNLYKKKILTKNP